MRHGLKNFAIDYVFRFAFSRVRTHNAFDTHGPVCSGQSEVQLTVSETRISQIDADGAGKRLSLCFLDCHRECECHGKLTATKVKGQVRVLVCGGMWDSRE